MNRYVENFERYKPLASSYPDPQEFYRVVLADGLSVLECFALLRDLYDKSFGECVAIDEAVRPRAKRATVLSILRRIFVRE